ncbi:MAG: hypothetical protein ACRD26_13220 [Vicinamibacterales bacterium]
MRACSRAAFAMCALGAALSAAPPPAPLRVELHHIHVNDHSAGYLLAYYGKLFDPATTRPSAIGDVRGIEAAGVFLLMTPVRDEPPDSGSAGWHFGWGTVSLDEAYDRHRMQEIDLKLPMASFAQDLHMHLESEDPVRAAEWYRDWFSARVKVESRNTSVQPANPFHRRPAAIVELPGIVFALYKSVGALGSSRGRRIDHVAFKADLRDARVAGFAVLEASGRLGPFETMTIEGPDRLAIELVGAPLLSRPATAAHLSSTSNSQLPTPNFQLPTPNLPTSQPPNLPIFRNLTQCGARARCRRRRSET